MTNIPAGYKQEENTPDIKEYAFFLQQIKNTILESRIKSAKSINRTFIGMYWFIGQQIIEKQQALGWGKSVVEKLSVDLKSSFPEMTGFSPQNLWLARQLYQEYSAYPNLQQLVGEVPWGHNVLIMQKIKDNNEKDKLEVEMSLRRKANPIDVTTKPSLRRQSQCLRRKANQIGVTTYQLYPQLPEEYKGKLPTTEEWKKLLEESVVLENNNKAGGN